MIAKVVIIINNNTKIRYFLLTLLITFFIISIITIYSASSFSSKQVLSKQVIWYLIGFGLIIITTKFSCKKILDISTILYIFINILLFLLLIFGTEVNGSKCWFTIPKLGSFQPSEFAKIILILINTKVFYIFNKKHPQKNFFSDVKLFLIIMIITLIPSILTFLEPDTGMVIIYFLISFIMLFIFGIRKSIFFIVIILAMLFVFSFLYFYFNYENTFINVFGTSFFYRIDRLLDWSSNNGMQLTNAMAAIKSAGLFGFGIGNTPIYIPEAHTDFIFSVYTSNFGLIGTIILITLLLSFDLALFKLAKDTNDKNYRFIITGFLAMIMYQQIQNISMNIGLLPITGITLPFISYGGSSLISYMIGIAIILNYDKNMCKVNNSYDCKRLPNDIKL